MRFAGDAFNKIVKTGGIDPFLRIMRTSSDELVGDDAWVPSPSPVEKAKDEAKNAAWNGIRGNRIMELNEKQVIGDSTLPELYNEAVNAYRRAVVSRAEELQIKGKMPPLVAIAQAMREVSPSDYSGGLPAEASFLRQYAAASRDPGIRKLMDLPENGEDEWGVLMSPLEAIKEQRWRSMPRSASAQDEDIFF